MTSLSIVVPTYQRSDLVGRALDSALAWLSMLSEAELIVVDDASTDGTAEVISARYRAELESGKMTLHRLVKNRGVTGAKNAGAAFASNAWIVFLDSDDRLIPEAALDVWDELRDTAAPVVFFRCTDMASGELIGACPPAAAEVGLRTLLSGWRWGECLPVVRREAALAFPYAEELRGYEGLAYARMVAALGPARVSAVVARRYDAGNHGRETTASRLSRWRRHQHYTETMLSEFFPHLSPRMVVRYALSNLRARFDGLRAAFPTRG